MLQDLVRQPARQSTVDEHKQGKEDRPAPGRNFWADDGGEQAEHGDGVEGQQQTVVYIEDPRVQEACREGHQSAEERRRVERAGQPVLAQQSVASLCQAVQEILVLVGVVQRCLAVGDGEGDRAQQQEGGRPGQTASAVASPRSPRDRPPHVLPAFGREQDLRDRDRLVIERPVRPMSTRSGSARSTMRLKQVSDCDDVSSHTFG